MNSPVIDQDLILEILSYLPTSKIWKIRLLSKEFNKRSYESWFLNLNIHRTNSLSGYMLQYKKAGNILETSFFQERRREFEENRVPIDFLPKAEIKACDASHGILLCLIHKTPSKPEYVVCKPTTKQFQIIPNQETKNYYPIMLGLAVTQSDNFRYKILKLSKSRGMNFRTMVCEVFDSGLFKWKRLRNIRLPKRDGFNSSNPVQASGYLNWLSMNQFYSYVCFPFCSDYESIAI